MLVAIQETPLEGFYSAGGGEIHAVDLDDFSGDLDRRVVFKQADVVLEPLPYPSELFDMITVVHLIEHIEKHGAFFSELYRILKPGGKIYIETPGLRRCFLPSFRIGLGDERFRNQAINFFDDPTHINPWSFGKLHYSLESSGFRIVKIGVSRNWMLGLLGTVLILFGAMLRHRTFFSQGLQNLVGCNIFAVAERD